MADDITIDFVQDDITVEFTGGGQVQSDWDVVDTSDYAYIKNKPSVSGINTGDQDLSGYVPYTGANTDVNLGVNDLIVNTDTLFVDASSGNVGIGEIAPDEKLEVAGRVHLGQTTAPATTTDKLYNVSGGLYWNGTALGGGGSSPLTTKGDVYTYSTVDARLGVGTDGQVLTADSTEAIGLKWTTFSSGGGLPTGYINGGVMPQAGLINEFVAMTSNTTPTGEEAWATGQFSSTYAPWRAFDKSTPNAWVAGSGVSTGILLRKMTSDNSLSIVSLVPRSTSEYPAAFTIVYTTDDMSGYSNVDATLKCFYYYCKNLNSTRLFKR